MVKYNYLDLFSGIAGFAIGAYKAGMRFETHKPYDKNNRLKGLGNSIVPAIAEILFRRIKEILDAE